GRPARRRGDRPRAAARGLRGRVRLRRRGGPAGLGPRRRGPVRAPVPDHGRPLRRGALPEREQEAPGRGGPRVAPPARRRRRGRAGRARLRGLLGRVGLGSRRVTDVALPPPPALPDDALLSWRDAAARDRARTGGKGANLARLVEVGLQVPPFFV